VQLLRNFRLGVGRDHVHARDHVRLLQLFGGLELLSVERHRVVEELRREVRGEAVRESEHRRELRTEQRRPEDVERYVRATPGCRVDAGEPRLVVEVALELEDVARERLRRIRTASHRAHRRLVATRRAPEPQVDATGVQRGERAELLGDDERRVVREHDPARSEPDLLGVCRDVRDQHRGG